MELQGLLRRRLSGHEASRASFSWSEHIPGPAQTQARGGLVVPLAGKNDLSHMATGTCVWRWEEFLLPSFVNSLPQQLYLAQG